MMRTTGGARLPLPALLAAGWLLLLAFPAAARAQDERQADAQQTQTGVTIRNTSREVKPGLYECVIYLEPGPEGWRIVDDVTYTLPTGFPNRKQKKKKPPFRSDPFNVSASEDVVVNVKIDYHGTRDEYLTYKVSLGGYKK